MPPCTRHCKMHMPGHNTRHGSGVAVKSYWLVLVPVKEGVAPLTAHLPTHCEIKLSCLSKPLGENETQLSPLNRFVGVIGWNWGESQGREKYQNLNYAYSTETWLPREYDKSKDDDKIKSVVTCIILKMPQNKKKSIHSNTECVMFCTVQHVRCWLGQVTNLITHTKPQYMHELHATHQYFRKLCFVVQIC